MRLPWAAPTVNASKFWAKISSASIIRGKFVKFPRRPLPRRASSRGYWPRDPSSTGLWFWIPRSVAAGWRGALGMVRRLGGERPLPAVEVGRASLGKGNVVIEKRFYISSLPAEKPLEILHAIRSHWQIERCLHWSLDVTFREDNCRIRNEKSFKRASIRRKQLKIWADPPYLSKVLRQI